MMPSATPTPSPYVPVERGGTYLAAPAVTSGACHRTARVRGTVVRGPNARGSRARRPPRARPRARCPRPRRRAPRRPRAIGVARFVRARHSASRTRTTPSGSTSTSATPISPISSSRPIVGVEKRDSDHCRHARQHEQQACAPHTSTSTHHAGSSAAAPSYSQIDPATSARAADERPRPEPAGLHVDREAEHAEQQQPDRPRRDREMREAEARADERDRADEPGDADARGEELEHDQREPATNRKYATHGVSSVCASCCAEIELAEAHVLVRPAPGGSRRRRRRRRVEHASRRRRGDSTWPSSATMNSPTRRLRSPSTTPRVERPSPTADRSTTARRSRCCDRRARASRPASTSRESGPVSSKSTGMHRTDVRARRDRRRSGARARAARSRRARRRPTDRPTPRSGPATSRPTSTSASTSTSTAPVPVELERRAATRRSAAASRSDVVISAAFGGSISPFDLHDVDARSVGRRRRRVCAARRPRRAAAPRPRAAHDGRSSSADSAYGRIASGSRSMRGWRLRSSAPPPTSSSSRARAASGRPPSRPRSRSPRPRAGSERAHRRGRGQIGAADDVRRARARLRRARPRRRDPGPLPHARRRARRLPRDPRAEAHLEAAGRVGRARGGRDRGARA